jgi:cellulose synthase/poly-beta-1,6-N-acetylglucosamine synthase-like glycosyltransferase
MIMLSLALWLMAAPLLVMFGVFTAEMLFGQRSSTPSGAIGPAPRVAVIMPAHNEAAGIAAIIAAVKARLPEGAQLLVVADNCTDDTAALARAAGADVIERHDPTQRGKGYALAFGQAHLRNAPPDCVVIIDADCVPDAGAVAQLATLACATGRPVQARYLFTTDAGTSPMVQISNFAFLIKNFVRQRGMAHMGGPALLTGTGMAFPWPIFERAPLASGNIVEDLALGIHFTAQGLTPLFAESATVWSEAASEADTITQRRRWEHGFIATARGQALPLIAAAIKQGKWPLVLLGAHLLVPPLALLLLLSMALLLILAVGGLAGGGFAPFLTMSMLIATGLTLTLIAWVRFGQSTLYPATLLRLPAYLLWKLPVYLGLLRGGETQWVRTKRPDE